VYPEVVILLISMLEEYRVYLSIGQQEMDSLLEHAGL
jgi:hypothetical protein